MAFTDSLEKHGNGYKNTVYGIWMDARKNLKMTTKNYIKIDNILWNWFFFLSKGNLIYFARQQLQKTARKPKKVKNFFRINVTE